MNRPLPHIGSARHTFFVTLSLAGALPTEAAVRLRAEYDADIAGLNEAGRAESLSADLQILRKRYFSKFDDLLHANTTVPKWLSADPVAEAVREAIMFRNGSLFELHACTLMPNHVHMLFTPRTAGEGGPPLEFVSTMLTNLKRLTARKANQIIGSSGAFWETGSFDLLVSDSRELSRINDFILQNPVRAGLVTEWHHWRWSYSRFTSRKST